MNYLQLILQFWQIRRSKRITSMQADLYYVLVQECNERHWENPFEYSNMSICARLNVSEKTVIEARNRLKQLGLIDFKAGERKKSSPVYTLLYCNNSSITPGNASVKEEVKPKDNTEPYNKLNGNKSSYSEANASEPVATKKNKKEKKSSSPPAPESEKQSSLHTACIARYADFIYAMTGNGPKIDGIQGKAMKSIIAYLRTEVRRKSSELTEEEQDGKILDSWAIILSNWHFLTPHLQSRTRISDINSELQNILKQIKDGIDKKTQPTGGKANTGASPAAVRSRGGSLEDLDALIRNGNTGDQERTEFTDAEVIN